MPERFADDQPVQRGERHRGIVALHAPRERPAALPAFQTGLRGRGLFGIGADEDINGEVGRVSTGLQIAVKVQQAKRNFPGMKGENS